MSFSNEVKAEICEAVKLPIGCKVSTLYGILCTARRFDESCILLHTESPEVAQFAVRLFGQLYHIRLQSVQLFNSGSAQKDLYQLELTEKHLCKAVCDSFDCGKYAETISLLSLDEMITWSYIKGIFLGCGSISDPGADYHMEFSFHRKNDAIFAENMLTSLSFSPRCIQRRGHFVVYLKDSGAIEDILTGVGAVRQSLQLMDTKVLRDLRNRLNRQNNCETANIKRTVDVAAEQVRAIEKIYKKRGREFLPDDLQLVADARLENPAVSLSVLQQLLSDRFSKSGIDRRLKKLVCIAEELYPKK